MAQAPQVAQVQQPADVREYVFNISDDLDDRKAGKQHKVRVQVDFTGYDLEIAKNRFFVSTSPRVALQGKLRGKKIPDGIYKCKATDFGTRGGLEVVERPMTAAEMIEAAAAGKFTPEQARALSEQLARMTATR